MAEEGVVFNRNGEYTIGNPLQRMDIHREPENGSVGSAVPNGSTGVVETPATPAPTRRFSLTALRAKLGQSKKVEQTKLEPGDTPAASSASNELTSGVQSPTRAVTEDQSELCETVGQSNSQQDWKVKNQDSLFKIKQTENLKKRELIIGASGQNTVDVMQLSSIGQTSKRLVETGSGHLDSELDVEEKVGADITTLDSTINQVVTTEEATNMAGSIVIPESQTIPQAPAMSTPQAVPNTAQVFTGEGVPQPQDLVQEPVPVIQVPVSQVPSGAVVQESAPNAVMQQASAPTAGVSQTAQTPAMGVDSVGMQAMDLQHVAKISSVPQESSVTVPAPSEAVKAPVVPFTVEGNESVFARAGANVGVRDLWIPRVVREYVKHPTAIFENVNYKGLRAYAITIPNRRQGTVFVAVGVDTYITVCAYDPKKQTVRDESAMITLDGPCALVQGMPLASTSQRNSATILL